MKLQSLVFILLLSIHIHKARDPETVIVYALIRNGTTPTDLVDAICRWILVPSEMSMNQLVQCRDRAARCLWGERCEELITEKISTGDENGSASITFTQCSDVYAIEMRKNATNHSYVNRRWYQWIERNKKLRISAVFRNTITGKVVRTERQIVIAGPRLELMVHNDSVSLYSLCSGRFSLRRHLEYTVENATFSWNTLEIEVTNVLKRATVD